jgi:hypothetical protein
MTEMTPTYVFEVFPGRNGRWRARRSDRLVEGVFVDRLSAVRFARREGAVILLRS